jgi:hypothetical protein
MLLQMTCVAGLLPVNLPSVPLGSEYQGLTSNAVEGAMLLPHPGTLPPEQPVLNKMEGVTDTLAENSIIQRVQATLRSLILVHRIKKLQTYFEQHFWVSQ